jgi:capsular polysaccharide biosynthesis protein
MTVALASYRPFVRTHWRASVLLGVAGLAAGLVVTWAMPAAYTSTTTVFAPATPTYLALDMDPFLIEGTPPPQEWTQDTEAELIHSDVVLRGAAKRLGSAWTVAAVSDRIQISVPTSARVFALSFTGRTPEEARRGAETVAREYVRQRSSLIADRTRRVSSALRDRRATLQEIIADAPAETDELPERSGPSALPVNRALRAQIRSQIAAIDKALTTAAATTANTAEIVQHARLPTSSRRTNAEVAPVSGLLSGLAAGLGVGYLRRRRRLHVEDAYDVGDVAGLPILARVPSGRFSGHSEDDIDAAGADHALRRLAAELEPALTSGTGRVIVLGFCADSLVAGFADVFQRVLASSTPTSAYDPEVVVTTSRTGARADDRHPEPGDVALVLVEYGTTTRRELARTVRGLRGRPAGSATVAATVTATGIVTLVPAPPPGPSGHSSRGAPG